MIKRVLLFGLIVALCSAANAQVSWDFTGAGFATTLWDDPANWSVTGTTSWTQPSAQYAGTPSLNVADAPADGPNYAYINADITAINIDGKIVDKTNETPPNTSSYLVMGGNNTVVTLDNAATLTVGEDMWTAEDIAGRGGVTNQIDVLNGSTFNVDLYRIGYGGTGIVNVTGGSFWNCATHWGRVASYDGGAGTVNVVDSTYYNHQSLHIGDAANTTAAFNLTNSTVDIGTRLRIGTGANGTATAIVDNTTLSIGHLGPDPTDTAGYLAVGRGAGSTGTMTVTNGSTITTSDYAIIGYAGATGTLSLTDSSLTVGDDPADDLRLGVTDGSGTVNLTNSTLTIMDYLYMGGDSGATTGTGTMDMDNSAATCNVARIARGIGVLENPGDPEDLTRIPGTGSTATVNVANGSSFTCATQLRIGYGGDGTVNVTGGSTLASDGNARISYQNGSRGYLNVTDSTYTSTGYTTVGWGVNTTGEATFNNSTVNIGVAETPADLVIGQSDATGTVDVLNGTVMNVGDDFYLGTGTIGHGTLNIDASSVTLQGDDMIAGNGGTGIVNVSNSGSLSIDGDMLAMANVNEAAVATLTVTGGSTVSSAGRTYAGYGAGTGTINVTDSTLNVGTDLRVGHTELSVGYVNIYGSSVVNVGRDLETCTSDGFINDPAYGRAYIHMYDGELNINGYLALGDSLQGDFTGNASYTEFIMDAGTVDIGLDPPVYDPWDFDPPVDGNAIGDLILGWYDYDADAYLTINGGEMTVNGAISFGSETRWTTEDPENPGVYIPTPHTGSGNGTLRITIDGGILQGEDLVYTGNTPDSLLTFSTGQLRVLGSAISEGDIAALITAGDIVCTGTYYIYSQGGYTVLSDSTAPTEIPGDANSDGKVDDADAEILGDNWGLTSATWAQGDFDGDTVVGPKDSAIMAANWGHGTSESSAVPEPTTLVLLVSAVLGLLVRRRR